MAEFHSADSVSIVHAGYISRWPGFQVYLNRTEPSLLLLSVTFVLWEHTKYQILSNQKAHFSNWIRWLKKREKSQNQPVTLYKHWCNITLHQCFSCKYVSVFLFRKGRFMCVTFDNSLPSDPLCTLKNDVWQLLPPTTWGRQSTPDCNKTWQCTFNVPCSICLLILQRWRHRKTKANSFCV